MSHIDDWGMRDFWYRIGDIFARRTEAGGSLSWNGSSSLTLRSVEGGDLTTVDLNNGMATDNEAKYTLTKDGAKITLSNAAGTVSVQIDLSTAINEAISQGTSGFITQNEADKRYARGLILSGKTLQLKNEEGGQIGNQVTLP